MKEKQLKITCIYCSNQYLLAESNIEIDKDDNKEKSICPLCGKWNEISPFKEINSLKNEVIEHVIKLLVSEFGHALTLSEARSFLWDNYPELFNRIWDHLTTIVDEIKTRYKLSKDKRRITLGIWDVLGWILVGTLLTITIMAFFRGLEFSSIFK